MERLKSIILPLSGAVLLSGVAGAVYYYFNKKDEDEVELTKSIEARTASVRVRVPIDAVGWVIGRQGANIKLIQERTNTRIDFADEEVDGNRTCTIRGSEEDVSLAQKLILKALMEKPVFESEEMLVPVMAVGKIIGRNGEVVRGLSHSSGAKIIVEREEDRPVPPLYPEDMRRIILKGSKEQIEAAKALVLEKVSEVAAMRKQINASAANMSHRARGRQSSQEVEPSQVSVSNGSLGQESLSTGSCAKFLEAYISAVDTASHFWLQVVGSRSVELDKLVTEMTEYYMSEDNRELHQLDEVKEGSVVAAKFPHDSSWYRGRVYKSEGTEEGSRQVTVYYVDFGDTETISGDDVCELRTDFLKLSFQAIECLLANIDPESVLGDEAADVFEELTYAAQWRSVMIKVVGYQEADGTTIPCVKILDTNGTKDVDVAEELVKRGLAKFAGTVAGPESS